MITWADGAMHQADDVEVNMWVYGQRKRNHNEVTQT